MDDLVREQIWLANVFARRWQFPMCGGDLFRSSIKNVARLWADDGKEEFVAVSRSLSATRKAS
jgi:hypothetical protein